MPFPARLAPPLCLSGKQQIVSRLSYVVHCTVLLQARKVVKKKAFFQAGLEQFPAHAKLQNRDMKCSKTYDHLNSI